MMNLFSLSSNGTITHSSNGTMTLSSNGTITRSNILTLCLLRRVGPHPQEIFPANRKNWPEHSIKCCTFYFTKIARGAHDQSVGGRVRACTMLTRLDLNVGKF